VPVPRTGLRAVCSVECCWLFNNSEGKGSLDLMRVRRAKGLSCILPAHSRQKASGWVAQTRPVA
jgi:hypothetical protein